jgi:hypothetical protein
MKFATDRPYADPEKAARKLVEIANSVEAMQDGRIFIELINAPMLFEHNASHRNDARVFNPDRKDTHWGKRKLKRDE